MSAVFDLCAFHRPYARVSHLTYQQEFLCLMSAVIVATCDSSFAHGRYTVIISTRCCASDTKPHFHTVSGCRFGRSPLLLLLQRRYVSQRGADLFLNWLYVGFTCPIRNTRGGDSSHTFSMTTAATFRSLQPCGIIATFTSHPIHTQQRQFLFSLTNLLHCYLTSLPSTVTSI